MYSISAYFLRIPRKALDKKSFPVSDACLYIFGSIDQRNETQKGFTSTIPTTGEVNDDVVPVTTKLVDTIREIHLVLGSQQDRKKFKKNKRKAS